MTHDYRRDDTTDLFAALNIAAGEVIAACRTRHTAADVLAFFKIIDRSVPARRTSTSCWDVCQPTRHRRFETGSLTHDEPAGTCT